MPSCRFPLFSFGYLISSKPANFAKKSSPDPFPTRPSTKTDRPARSKACWVGVFRQKGVRVAFRPPRPSQPPHNQSPSSRLLLETILGALGALIPPKCEIVPLRLESCCSGSGLEIINKPLHSDDFAALYSFIFCTFAQPSSYMVPRQIEDI